MARREEKRKEWSKEYYKRNKHKKNLQSREWYLKEREGKLKDYLDRSKGERKKKRETYYSEHYAHNMFVNAKARAKRKNITFTLTEEWIVEKLTEDRCDRLGISMSGKGKRTFNTPSIDRLDPKKGYTPDNCRIICWGWNAFKGAWGEEGCDIMVQAALDIEKEEAWLNFAMV